MIRGKIGPQLFGHLVDDEPGVGLAALGQDLGAVPEPDQEVQRR